MNRGWVPRDHINPATRQKGQVQGRVQITAIVRKCEKVILVISMRIFMFGFFLTF